MIEITETNVTVMVNDINASIAFYEKIGMKLKHRWDSHYAMMQTTGLTIGLHPTEAKIPSSSQVSFGFMVEDIKEAKFLLNETKVPYTEESGKSGIYLHFNDPDGAFLYFTQPSWKY